MTPKKTNTVALASAAKRSASITASRIWGRIIGRLSPRTLRSSARLLQAAKSPQEPSARRGLRYFAAAASSLEPNFQFTPRRITLLVTLPVLNWPTTGIVDVGTTAEATPVIPARLT